MAAETLEMAGARAEAGMEIERRDRASRALPLVAAARDEDDGAVEPLDESRGHDADHALVPVLAPQHIRAPAPAGLRPFRDLLHGGPQHPVLDRLAVPVQHLELAG